MRYIFYCFTFLFLTVLAQAQQSITYVSFFPSAHIVHNEVTLTQRNDNYDPEKTSFYEYDLDLPMHNHHEYHKKQGGLILGAADGSNIVISTMTVSANNYSGVVVNNFNVDNFIKVQSLGAIGETAGANSLITIGADTAYSGGDNSKFFLSAGRIKFILTPMPPIGIYGLIEDSKMYISDSAAIPLIKVADRNWNAPLYVCPNVPTPYGDTPSQFIPELSDGDKLVWCNLRINGHEQCRKYLVKFSKDEEVSCDLAQKAICREDETNR